MTSRRGRAAEEAARAHHAAGDYQRSLDGYVTAFELCSAEGDVLAAARAARTIGWLHGWVFGQWALYEGWTARAEALLSDADDLRARAWLRFHEARRGSDLETQRSQYLDAIRSARRAGDVDLECEATASLGMMLVYSGCAEEGIVHLDHALAVICGGGVAELPVLEGCLCGLLSACERTHDVQRAEQWLQAAEGVVRRNNLRAAAGFCRAHYAGILISAGRWRDAEQELGRALGLLAEGSSLRGAALSRLADLRIGQGRLDEAAVLLRDLEGDEDALLPTARLHLASGRPELALELVDRALASSLPDYAEAELLATRVECLLALGDLDPARRASQRLDEIAGDQPAPAVHAQAAAIRGRVAAAEAVTDAAASAVARAAWHRAISLYSRSHMPVEVARCRLELAGILGSERTQAAVAEASAALRAFESVGAARMVDAASALIRELGGPARAGPKRGTLLTAREEQVLALIGHGLTNSEIGQRLFISSKTVEHHVTRILAKLGVRSRTQAAAHAVRRSAV